MSSWFDGSYMSILNMAVVGAVAYGIVQLLWPRKQNNEEAVAKARALWDAVNKLPQLEFTMQVRCVLLSGSWSSCSSALGISQGYPRVIQDYQFRDDLCSLYSACLPLFE